MDLQKNILSTFFTLVQNGIFSSEITYYVFQYVSANEIIKYAALVLFDCTENTQNKIINAL